ncbi:MAG: Rho termination factor N-terminal domain-containing protein, partial [Prochlorococcaceae cyanobacterium]
MNQSLSSLARLTLRQLRRVASDLGVALYSRKSKDELLDAISTKQEFSAGEKRIETAISLAEMEAGFGNTPLPLPETRVVFLPRDPQWAYV